MANILHPRTIRGQLNRILALTLSSVLVLLSVIAYREIAEYRRSGDTLRAVAVALAVQDLIHETQRERGLSNGLLGGDPRLRQQVSEQREHTGDAIGALDLALANGAPGAERVRTALGKLTGLDNLRARVDERNVDRQAAFQFYTDAVDALNGLSFGPDHARDDAVRRGLEALRALGEAKEHTAKERGFLNGVFAAEGFGPGEFVQFLDIRAAKAAGLAAFSRDATPRQQAALDGAMRSTDALAAGASERIALDSNGTRPLHGVDPITWWARMTTVVDDQRAAQHVVGADIRARADEVRAAAARNVIIALLGAALAVAAMVALVIVSVRAIIRPLAALAAEADDIATRRMPEGIAAWLRSGATQPEPPRRVSAPDGSSIEIAAVARTLDRVQLTAFELAAEQALIRRNTTESMANLARRNQNLVCRQLGLISKFERDELDPLALGKLFELDHLATRMRRNAESLLVLTGQAGQRRWAAPMPLTDVIHAGLSEVDDYRRVSLRRVDEVVIAGGVVNELAHMLAELIDNGLAFSPPGLEVEIAGRRTPGGYLLAVIDHGIGMPVDQLAIANARLRGEQDFVVTATRYLGHYVIGRLARRLGVTVELTAAPISGIVARMALPPRLLATERDVARAA
ncbi:nitrate- and nitrite sensing domain-containing protein [Nocardia sp. NPDC052566]|uniref:sensor histidine kinase n=1 Tax=Nocardia sp. NPDC052566 TaxID=3364330 RepID=UPI0037C70A65